MLKLESASKTKGNKEVDELINVYKKKFEEAMDDDLQISEALAAVFEFVKAVNRLEISKKDADKVRKLMINFNKVFGIKGLGEKEKISKEIEEMIKKREEARKKKDFETADKIRNELKKKGIILEDTPQGARWKKVN